MVDRDGDVDRDRLPPALQEQVSRSSRKCLTLRQSSPAFTRVLIPCQVIAYTGGMLQLRLALATKLEKELSVCDEMRDDATATPPRGPSSADAIPTE